MNTICEHSKMEKCHQLLQGIIKKTAQPRGDYSLYAGNAGDALFYAYLFKLYDDRTYLEKASALIDTCLQIYQEQEENDLLSLANGFTGLAWVLAHLLRENIIELEDSDSILKNWGEKVSACSSLFFQSKNVDVLHGGMGGALYFLETDHLEGSVEALNVYLNSMNLLSFESENAIYWESIFTFSDNADTQEAEKKNLGYAHGLAGLLRIFSACYQLVGIDKQLCKKMMEKAAACILSYKSPSLDTISLFPIHVVERFNPDDYNVRMGWCYGDLTIGYAIWEAGKSLNDSSLALEGMTILEHCAVHRTQDNAVIDDTYLCHGSGGVAHLFNHIYQVTSMPVFKDAADYWYNYTFDHIRLDGSKDGLLTGYTGVGLSLISFLDEKLHSWHRSLYI